MSADSVFHNPHLDGAPFDLPGGEKAALLIHGFTATPHEVRKLGGVLNRTGLRVVGMLLPGHGQTPEALNKTRWQDWYESCNTRLQELLGQHSKVFVGGESLGGLLALLLAARNPAVAGVLAYAPALRLSLTTADVIKLKLAAPFVASQPKTDLEGNKTWQGYKVNPLKAVLQLMAAQETVKTELAMVTQPALIVQGKLDQTIDPQSAQMVYDSIGSTLKEIHWMERSGHCVLLEKEVHVINRLTMDFIYKVK